MPLDSVESFLAFARGTSLLSQGQLAEATQIAESGTHTDSLSSFVQFLHSRGFLTPFQLEKIRLGSGESLVLGRHVLLTDLGEFAHGHAYTARQADSAPVTLIQLPVGEVHLATLQAATCVRHPHLPEILEVGSVQGHCFLVLKSFDGMTLESLVKEIGPMPTLLAVRYSLQAASALEFALTRNQTHGQLSPSSFWVGPVESTDQFLANGLPMFRPSAEASCRLMGLGWIPTSATPAEDVQSLADCLVYLLTAKLDWWDAETLKTMRPDLRPEFVAMLARMRNPEPAERPTISEVVLWLEAHDKMILSEIVERAVPPDVTRATPLPESSKSGPVLTAVSAIPTPVTQPSGWVLTPYEGPSTESRFVLPDLPVVNPSPFASVASDSTESPFKTSTTVRRPRARSFSSEDKTKLKLWALVGLGFWVTAGFLWLILLNQSGCFSDKAASNTSSTKKQSESK